MYMTNWKKDIIGMKITEPSEHIINFYLNSKMLHRVFEPTFKTRLFIPCKGDWITIENIKYEILSRDIEYLPNKIVATVNVQKII